MRYKFLNSDKGIDKSIRKLPSKPQQIILIETVITEISIVLYIEHYTVCKLQF